MSSNKDTIILGIESSCDETSAAIIKNGEILSNVTASQEIHSRYGGVVPELASRAHQQNIIPVVHEALLQAGITKKELSAIAFTRGPGLLGSLLVGTSFAKAMSLALNIPLLEVNHMHAHILAHFIQKPGEKKKVPRYPFICLTVSGGHTQLVKVDSDHEFTILGETIDDAAGEAFDKSAKMLDLPYPGGPLIDKYGKNGDANKFKFNVSKGLGRNFSFSGLKTSVLYFLRDELKKDSDFIQKNLPDLCASIQASIVNILIDKSIELCLETGIHELAIAGGVSANSFLRSEMIRRAEAKKIKVFIPAFEYCTDNAAMIAMNGHYLYQRKVFAGQDLSPDARLEF